MNCRYTEEFSDLYKLYPENPQASITRKKENDSVIWINQLNYLKTGQCC